MQIRKPSEDKINNLYATVFLFIVFGALLYLISIGYMRYDTNDDFFLSIFSSGFLGDYCAYNIYSNIVLGVLNIEISKITNSFHLNGSTFFYLIEILLSYSLLGYRLVKEKGIRGAFEACAFMIVTVPTILNRHNYSKTGALVTIVGGYILASKKEDDSILTDMLAGFLLITGGLYRKDTLLAVFPFLIICFFYGCCCKKQKSKKNIYIIEWGTALGVLIILWLINGWAYKSNSEWNYFTKFNNLRQSIIDYGIPDYNEFEQEYKSIGWLENDCQFFSEWNFADNTVYDVDSLQIISDMTKDNRSIFSVRRWGHTVKIYVRALAPTLLICFKSVMFWLILLMTIGIVIYDKSKWIYSLASISIVFGEVLYLSAAGRTPERAVVIPFICGFVTLLLFESIHINICMLLTMLVTLCITCGVHKYPSQARKYMPLKDEMNACLEVMSEDESSLFVWDIFTLAESVEKAYAPLDELPYGYFSNSVFMGGWIVPSPVFTKIGNKYGDGNNLVKLLLENDNVYYVSSKEPSDSFVLYYKEHYNVDINVSTVNQIGRFNIYSISE